MDVKSDGEGTEARFTITLARTSTTDPSDARASVTLAPAASQLRVFVVDDNADAAGMLAMLIDGPRYHSSSRRHPRRPAANRFEST